MEFEKGMGEQREEELDKRDRARREGGRYRKKDEKETE
jgi:hypothetical protein